MKREKRSSGDVGALSLKLKKGGLGRPESLIHEGDSRLTYVEIKKMGLKHAPSSYNCGISKNGIQISDSLNIK